MISYRSIFRLTLSVFLFSLSSAAFGQKYPSLLWEVTGNGLQKPSYLYGTMHVSNKIAFYLGDPFFDALENAEMVALELEPEKWFDEVLSDKNQYKRNVSDYGGGYGEWNIFKGIFNMDLNVNNTLKMLYMQDPMTYNTLLFRLYEPSGNFEEETWLDMYIYQSARKLGKKTVGLESYEMANNMMDRANKEISEEDESKRKKRKQLSYTERQEVSLKIEDAYRKANLDVLDSLNALMSHPSFTKYILYERNKNFVKGLDTLMRKQSVFAGFGAAHLPGEKGCVELLRELGYTVKPMSLGKRNAKKRQKLEDMILKRKVQRFTIPDGSISFEIPGTAYALGGGFQAGNLLAMDIPNGTNFLINRIPSRSSFVGMTPEAQLKSLDSILYEVIPGEIVSKKVILVSGHPALDITNKTRRGDIHRSQIIFLQDEIVMIRLSASGDKIRRGLAGYFFSSIQINIDEPGKWRTIESKDGSFSYEAPARAVSYSKNQSDMHLRNVYEYVVAGNGDVFATYRIATDESGYLEEDPYTFSLLANAIEEDLDIEITHSSLIQDGAFRQRTVYEPYKGRKVFALFRTNALSHYAFIAYTNDSLSADRFFNSVQIKNSTFGSLYEMIDSATFFRSRVPWEVENKKQPPRSYYSSFGSQNEDENPAESYEKYKTVYPPFSTDRIHITYERFNRYDYVHDTSVFLKMIEKEITHGHDEHIESKKIVWDPAGLKADYHTSDTFTSRRYHYRILWQRRSMHRIKTTYDVSLGEGPVTLAFLEHFEPLEDTLSIGSYLESPLSQLKRDVISNDTIVFEGANDFIETAYRQYKDKEVLDLFTMLKDTTPVLAKKEDKDIYSNYFVAIQYLDHSKEHLDRLAMEYKESSDSSLRQMEILVTLLKMNRKESHLLAKKLLLNEAPIGVKVELSHPLVTNLMDSLKLARLFFPEILELTAYFEYESVVVRVLAEMMDSNALDHTSYAPYLPYLVREAKVQFRRFSSSTQEEPDANRAWKEDDWKYLGDQMMPAYWKLLYPFRKKPEVSEIFKSAGSSSKRHVREIYARFLATEDVKVSDKECEYLTSGLAPLYRYSMLKDVQRLDLLKDTNWVSLYIADQIRSLGSDFNDYNWEPIHIDSMKWVKSQEDSIRRVHYTTYYLKFKRTVDNKTSTRYAIVMVKKTDDNYPPFEYLSESAEIEIDQTEDELFKDLRNSLIAEYRDNDYPMYTDRNIRFDFMYYLR